MGIRAFLWIIVGSVGDMCTHNEYIYFLKSSKIFIRKPTTVKEKPVIMKR